MWRDTFASTIQCPIQERAGSTVHLVWSTQSATRLTTIIRTQRSSSPKRGVVNKMYIVLVITCYCPNLCKDDPGNRESIGINRQTVKIGQRFNPGFYNGLVSRLLKNSTILTPREACLKYVGNIAVIQIEMLFHDALQITRVPTRNLVKEMSIVGMPLILLLFIIIHQVGLLSGGIVSLYVGASTLSAVEVFYWIAYHLLRAKTTRMRHCCSKFVEIRK